MRRPEERHRTRIFSTMPYNETTVISVQLASLATVWARDKLDAGCDTSMCRACRRGCAFPPFPLAQPPMLSLFLFLGLPRHRPSLHSNTGSPRARRISKTFTSNPEFVPITCLMMFLFGAFSVSP